MSDSETADRTVTVKAVLDRRATRAAITYRGIAMAIPEPQRLELEQILRSFKRHLDNLGLVVPEGGELQIEINPDAEYEACFFPNTGRISMKPAWANDPSVVLREYAHYALFTAAKNAPRRVQQAGLQGSALESGLADYLPCSFVGDPVLGRIGAPVVFKAPCIRDLSNQLTMADFDSTSMPQHVGQVWGGLLWELRKFAEAEVTASMTAEAWLAACASRGSLPRAFAAALVKNARKSRGTALANQLQRLLKGRAIQY